MLTMNVLPHVDKSKGLQEPAPIRKYQPPSSSGASQNGKCCRLLIRNSCNPTPEAHRGAA
jgi:hypothetical protein